MPWYNKSMICCDEPKRVGSYLLIDSDKIKEHCPKFIKWCTEERDKDERDYVNYWMERINSTWFRRMIGPMTYEETERSFFGGSLSNAVTHMYNHPSQYLSKNKKAAERILSMAQYESRVFVSAEDFDLVFRSMPDEK